MTSHPWEQWKESPSAERSWPEGWGQIRPHSIKVQPGKYQPCSACCQPGSLVRGSSTPGEFEGSDYEYKQPWSGWVPLPCPALSSLTFPSLLPHWAVWALDHIHRPWFGETDRSGSLLSFPHSWAETQATISFSHAHTTGAPLHASSVGLGLGISCTMFLLRALKSQQLWEFRTWLSTLLQCNCTSFPNPWPVSLSFGQKLHLHHIPLQPWADYFRVYISLLSVLFISWSISLGPEINLCQLELPISFTTSALTPNLHYVKIRMLMCLEANCTDDWHSLCNTLENNMFDC